jgi:hypothetical protein
MKLYRFTGSVFRDEGDDPRCVIYLKVLDVVKETPCGFWVHDGRWISKTARKRYAYPTIDEARHAFRCRTRSHVEHCQRRLEDAQLVASEEVGDYEPPRLPTWARGAYIWSNYKKEN